MGEATSDRRRACRCTYSYGKCDFQSNVQTVRAVILGRLLTRVGAAPLFLPTACLYPVPGRGLVSEPIGSVWRGWGYMHQCSSQTGEHVETPSMEAWLHAVHLDNPTRHLL
jgi:hypothetical protein